MTGQLLHCGCLYSGAVEAVEGPLLVQEVLRKVCACLEQLVGLPSWFFIETGFCLYSDRIRSIHFHFILASTVSSLSANLSLSHCVLSWRACERTCLCGSCSVALSPAPWLEYAVE